MENLISILSNGFRRCGLYPWDVEAVNYTVLVRKDTHVAQERNTSHEHSNLDQTRVPNTTLLMDLQLYMTEHQIEIFNLSDTSGEWLGNLGETALFDVWKRIKYERPYEDEPPFEGFTEEEMRGNAVYVISPPMFTKSFFFSTAPDASKLNADQVQPLDLSYHSEPDTLTETFRLPNVEQKIKLNRKSKPQPPSVATSSAYDEYLENIENIKNAELLEKAKKKREKESKRKIKSDQIASKKKKHQR